MGLLGSQAGNEKNYKQLLTAVFSGFHGQK
jgi:hypothetical protein